MASLSIFEWHEAVSCDGLCLKYGNRTVCSNRFVVLAAVRQNGQALQWAWNTLRDDLGIVLAAVDNNGSAIEHASSRLRQQRDVALIAVQNRHEAFLKLSPEMRMDDELLHAAIQQERSHDNFRYWCTRCFVTNVDGLRLAALDHPLDSARRKKSKAPSNHAASSNSAFHRI